MTHARQPPRWPRGIFFDFDGVIVESAEIKTQAFGALFSAYGDSVRDAIVAYHTANAGISRFDKFDFIYEQVLNEPLTSETKDALGARFEQLVYDRVVAAPFVPGAREFLELYGQQIPCFIVSATPHDELHKILAARQLLGLIQDAFGSPMRKSDSIGNVLRREALTGSDVVVVGDSWSDYEAAISVGAPFIGRVPEGSPDPFGQIKDTHPFAIINDLSSLQDALSLA